jgi:protein SCO1/2
MATRSNGTHPVVRWLRPFLGAVALAVLAGYALSVSLNMYLGAGARDVRYSGKADIRSEFSLTDHTGRAVTHADYADRWKLVFFGFTNCPDVCPTTLAYMASVIDLLGEDADRLAPLFITVDPIRDTVPVMAEYVSMFHPQLIGLTGTEAQVAKTARNFRTWYKRTEDETAHEHYSMAHSGRLYLMRPDGEFDAVYSEGDHMPEDLAREIFARMKSGGSSI